MTLTESQITSFVNAWIRFQWTASEEVFDIDIWEQICKVRNKKLEGM